MAEEIWVVNSSPLISLAKIGQLALLTAPGRQLVVPKAVSEEILAGPETDPARTAIEAGFGADFPSIEVPPKVAEWSLGRGESAVLAFALEIGGIAIVDDRDARRAAGALGTRVLGTLGVVLRSRREGRIPEAAPLIRELRYNGLRLDERLIATTLEEAFGEVWDP